MRHLTKSAGRWPQYVYTRMKSLNDARNRAVHDNHEEFSKWQRQQFIHDFEAVRDGMRQMYGYDRVAKLYQICDR